MVVGALIFVIDGCVELSKLALECFFGMFFEPTVWPLEGASDEFKEDELVDLSRLLILRFF